MGTAWENYSRSMFIFFLASDSWSHLLCHLGVEESLALGHLQCNTTDKYMVNKIYILQLTNIQSMSSSPHSTSLLKGPHTSLCFGMGGVGQIHWVIGMSLRRKALITERNQGIIKWEEDISSRANGENCRAREADVD